MEGKTKIDRNVWNNPIPLALLTSHNYEKSIGEILENESSIFLNELRNQYPEIFPQNSYFVPIEKIIQKLNIDVFHHSTESFSATISKNQNKFSISLDKRNIFSFYLRRFSLAHEIAHIYLRQLVGPLTSDELWKTKNTNYEEEILCDFFASALLMPKKEVTSLLSLESEFNQNTIFNLAKIFKVSRGIALRRLSDISNSILLFWDKIENPLTKERKVEQRIKQIYKPLNFFSKYYIPRYCTSVKRFEPDIIEKSLIEKNSISETVEIKSLGDLPEKKYFVQNIFFQEWTENLLKSGVVINRNHFYNMATFIHTHYTKEDLESDLNFVG